MIWIILAVLVLVSFVIYRFTKRLLIDIRAGNAKQNGLISKKDWQAIPFVVAGVPLRMVLTEVANKSAYQGNFKVMSERFIDVALIADDKLDAKVVRQLQGTLYKDLADIRQPIEMFFDLNMRESNMVLSAIFYALICTQDKGANIKRRLMVGKDNNSENNMYLQQKTDREYFEYMNDSYPNFCQMVSILEPRKANLIEVVAGYLLTD